jgi:hypothetical protein
MLEHQSPADKELISSSAATKIKKTATLLHAVSKALPETVLLRGSNENSLLPL